MLYKNIFTIHNDVQFPQNAAGKLKLAPATCTKTDHNCVTHEQFIHISSYIYRHDITTTVIASDLSCQEEEVCWGEELFHCESCSGLQAAAHH